MTERLDLAETDDGYDHRPRSGGGVWTFLVAIMLAVVVVGMCFWIGDHTTFGRYLSGHVLRISCPETITVAADDSVIVDVQVAPLYQRREVRIVGARVPCSCLGIEPIPMTLLPGETQTLHVRLDATGLIPGSMEMEIPLLLNVAAPATAVRFNFVVTPSVSDGSGHVQ